LTADPTPAIGALRAEPQGQENSGEGLVLNG